MSQRDGGRLPLWACAISLALHIAGLSALALPFAYPWRTPTLAGSQSVVSVELKSVSADAVKEDSEVLTSQLAAESPHEKARENRLERLTAASVPTRLSESVVMRNPVPRLTAAVREKPQRPLPDQADALPRVLVKRKHLSPLPVVATAASATATGFDPTDPQPIEQPKPVYPELAVARGWQGTVGLRLLIGAAGQVESVKVVGSSGFAVLDQAAVEAVRRWLFRPATRAGIACARAVFLPVVFDLSRLSTSAGS